MTFSMGTARLLGLLRLLTGISLLQQGRSWIITVPTTITAAQGSCVVVPCQTKPHSRVTWYQYHKIHYPVVYDKFRAVQSQFKGRTSVPGEAAEGNCTLIINNVRKTDDNLQVYVWIDPDTAQTQKFHHQIVTISVERKAPILSTRNRIVEGEIFEANCSINHSCPASPPSLHWNRSPFFLKNYTLMAFNQEGKGQWLYTETMHVLATYEMHNSNVRCSAQFSTFTTESQQITLNVFYKPVTVTLSQKKMEVDSVIVECAATCNPQPHTYLWLKRQMGQTTKINSTQRIKSFSNIKRDTSLSCIAHNDVGEGQSDWLDLDVQYAPVILPESYCHLTGQILKCVCLAEASPNASVHVTIDGNETLLSSFSFVSTHKKNVVSREISGPAKTQSNISCTATNFLGNDTKQLSVNIGSKTTSLLIWVSASVLLGIVMVFGCLAAVFVYRKYSGDRQTPGFECNTRPQSLHAQQEDIYNNTQRSQDEDTQSSPCRPESNPEVDGPFCVYENVCVENLRRPTSARQNQSNAAACQRQAEIQPLAKVQ